MVQDTDKDGACLEQDRLTAGIEYFVKVNVAHVPVSRPLCVFPARRLGRGRSRFSEAYLCWATFPAHC